MNYSFFEPIIIFTLINITMTLGLYVTALSGQLSMATAAIGGVGGYTAGVLAVNFGWGFIPTLVAAALAAGAVGVVLAFLTASMKDFVLKLTTLAFGEALTVVAFNTDYIGGANGFQGLPLRTGVGTCVIVALFALYIAWRFDGSRFGFAARAVRDDRDAASSMGLSVTRIRVITFALGSMLVGLGGAVQANYVLIVSPSELGFFSSINYIIYLLFGGLYTLWGPVLGAAVLTIAPEALRFAAAYRLVAYGAIIIAIVLWRPDGVLRRVCTGPRRAGWLGMLPGRRRPLPSSTSA